MVPNLLTANTNTAGGDSANTASVSPVANRLHLLAVYGHPVGANAVPTVSGAGMTWVQVAHNSYDPSVSGNGLTIFRAASASPGSGALTIDFGVGEDQVGIGWVLLDYPGAKSSGGNGADGVRNVVSNTGAGLTASVTLGAFASVDNDTFSASSVAALRSGIEGSGFNLLSEVSESVSGTTLFTQYQEANDTSVTNGWSGAGTPAWGIIGLEVVAEEVAPTADMAWVRA